MVSTAPKVFIIILNWNGKDDTCLCVQAVKQIDYPNYEIVIVDNGSQDDSVKTFEDKFSEVPVIETGSNLGYAGGNNQGISYALANGADYVLILNNDAIVDRSILSSLVDAADQHPQAGILGPKIYYNSEPRKIWFAGGVWLSNSAQTAHEGSNQVDDGQAWENIREIDYACGCAFFVRAEVFRKIGLLEEKFFLTWEETDFCYRARKSGFQCLFVPAAHVWHKVSASFKGGAEGLLQQYFMTRNRLLWMERNLPLTERLKIYRIVFLPEFEYYIRSYFSSKSTPAVRKQSRVKLTAIKDYLFRRFGDCPDWIREI